MNEFVPLLSSWACCCPVRTCVAGGRMPRICASSSSVETFGFALTAISSSCPGLAKSFCAVGRSNPASVAPPMVETEPNLTMPATRRCRTGPSASTPIVWPTAKCSLCATDLSITTSSPCGHRPLISVSGLNGESPLAMLKPRFGAPPYTTALPSLPISCAVPLTAPSATSTPGRARTFASRDSSKVGACAPLSEFTSKADLPLMTASEPWRLVVKIEPKALSIESVSTYVPLTVATPSTIAKAVRIVRSLRPNRPLSANAVTNRRARPSR